ncbi:MAG: type IV pilus secretin PilQ [Nitrospirae bacterium]|nr:type IV pilus secretin PilQ [Nitrospirota bacterium]
MKTINFKRAVCAALIALLFVVFPSAGDQVKAAEPVINAKTPDVPVLRRIDIVELQASTQILLETGNSLKYTSFILMDPPRFVVDLPGVSLGEFTKTIKVDKGSVIQIDPVETTTPVRIARLNIKLSDDKTVPQILSKSNVLIIDIPTMTPVPVPEQASVKPQLNMVRELIFNETKDNNSLKIVADNEISVDSFIVEGDKLVVDVRDADTSIGPSEKVVDSNLISKIRMGVHSSPSNKVRFVADLKRAVKYEVNKQGNEITINVYPKEEMTQTAVRLAASKPVLEGNIDSGDTDSAASVTPKVENTPKVEVSQLPKVDKVKASAVPQEDKVESTPKVEVAQVPKVEKVKAAAAPQEVKADSSSKVEAPQAQKEKNISSADTKVASVPPGKNNNGQLNNRKVSLDFQDADVVNVLRLLAEVSKLNMIIGDNVKGKITVKMLDIPWDQALNIILKMKGLGKIHENNVVRIDTLASIAQQQEEEARAKDAMVKAEDVSTKIIPVNYARARELAESIKKTLSARGDITIDERTNTLIVKDVADKHEEISNLLKTLDRPTPQVLIEARIVQADTNFARDLGVQWGGNYASNPGDYNMSVVSGPTGTVSAPTTGFAVNLPATGIAGTKGSVGFTIGKTIGDAFNLDLRLSAGETKGLTKILSAPKIATLDNREAIIQQGESIPYKTYSQEGTKTEFIDATLTLKVTPKVTPDGHISMNINITKNRQGSIIVEGTPSINKKEATTEVLVKDGETTVIGGIYELSDSDNASMLPWMNKIPILGWLFKNTSQSNIKSELLIFITPKIIPVTS